MPQLDDPNQPDPITPPTEANPEAQKLAKRWLTSISQAEKLADKFNRKGRKIVLRYRANQKGDSDTGATLRTTQFNLFWSNVQTLAPATYSRKPKVEAYRRFQDQDPVGRLAGMILQRGLQYEVDRGMDLHLATRQAVLDRLLPGLGQAWVRYEPAFKKEEVEQPKEDGSLGVEMVEQEVLSDERTPVDYVFWEDFLISPARTWTDVRWVARKVLFTKEGLESRFGKSFPALGGKIDDVPCDQDPSNLNSDKDSTKNTDGLDTEADDTLKRALVYEIWDKELKEVIWVYKGGDLPLDVVPDPFQLEEFFPCPQPLLATTTNDQILPVADFLLYQDQLRELDVVTQRISLLVKALRLVGVYDASNTTLAGLFDGGMENQMIPVNAWAAFAEKGGLKSAMDFLPLEQVFKILQGLYDAREQLKQTVYEITGMSDIVRGQSIASETLGAQQIKAKFANLRLSSRQEQVAEWVTCLLRIKAEIMCTKYSPETLLRISSIEQVPEAIKHPERVQEALALLKNESARNYRIEVAADSMIELDEVDERSRRTEFMEAVSNFMNAAKNITSFNQHLLPVVLEMLKFVVRGFKTGRGIESSIEDAEQKIIEESQNPQPPQPDPDVVLKKEMEDAKQQAETARNTEDNKTKLRIAGMKEMTALDTKGQELEHKDRQAANSQAFEAEQGEVQAQRDQSKQEQFVSQEDFQSVMQLVQQLQQQIQILTEQGQSALPQPQPTGAPL